MFKRHTGPCVICSGILQKLINYMTNLLTKQFKWFYKNNPFKYQQSWMWPVKWSQCTERTSNSRDLKLKRKSKKNLPTYPLHLSINIYHASKKLNSEQIKHEYEEMLNVRLQTLLFTILHKCHIPAGSQTTIEDKLKWTAIHKNQMGMEYFLQHSKYNTCQLRYSVLLQHERNEENLPVVVSVDGSHYPIT